MLNAKKVVSTGGARHKQEVLEPGTYPARVVQIIDMGVQDLGEWDGQHKGFAHKIRLTYELLDEFMKDENGDEDESKPRWVSEDFPFKSLSLDLATSTKRYNAICPDDSADGDFTKLIGAACNVVLGVKTAKKSGNDYNKVLGVSPVRSKEAAKMEALKNEPLVLSLDDEENGVGIFDSLPDWLKDDIRKATNFSETFVGGGNGAANDEPVIAQENDDEEEWA